jgi:hypothetical protein
MKQKCDVMIVVKIIKDQGKAQSRILVTRRGVWIGNWIY